VPPSSVIHFYINNCYGVNLHQSDAHE